MGPAAAEAGLARLEELLAGLPVVALQPDDGVYRARELRAVLRVSRRSVERWIRESRLPVIRTPGGGRRFPAGPVNALLRGSR